MSKKMASMMPGTPGTAAAPVKKAPRSSLLRSCERCRRRKIRCDDYFPCAACTRLGLQCKVSEDRKAERTQSYLEERVRRLESLLAQQESRDGASPIASPMTRSGSMSMPESSQNLRLQIPASPAMSMSPAPEDFASSPGPDFQDFQGYTSSYCSSPIDFANSPASDLPPWSSSDAFNVPDQASFFDYPRRARSFPSAPEHNYPNVSTNVFGMGQDNSLIVPHIPTIEVTSWDTQSNLSNGGGMNDITFNVPDLSWSNPPSPSLTALSHDHDLGNEEYLSDVDLGWRSRRSSLAYSERSFTGSDSLKPTASITQTFSHSRPRSRSDVLPQGSRYLDANGFHPGLEQRQSFGRSIPTPVQSIPSTDEAHYARTFFDRVHPYFPIISPQTFQSYAVANALSSDQHTNMDKFKILLILAIGSQFESNAGRCSSSTPDLYFNMAQQLYPPNAWQQTPSLETTQGHLLLAIYTLLSAYSPPFSTESIPTSHDPTKPSIWMLNAITTASVMDLNFHSRVDLDEMENDAFVSAYVLDMVVSMLLGKPKLLRGLSIDVGRMRRLQGTAESSRMMLDEVASEDLGSGWRCVLEWYRTEGRNFVQ